MHCTGRVLDDVFYVGSSDRRLELFENVFPIPKGVSYNSYLVMDERTVLIDTVDRSVSSVFLENVEHVLGGRPLDYLIVNHMEPDHAATIGELRLRHPETQIVATKRALDMVGQFFDDKVSIPSIAVKEGDTLETGRHRFTFVNAPMVHWPEVMVTYDITDKVLFSADAFGTFGALDGSLFADEYDFNGRWLDEARRYYTNIVGKYGVQVQALLKKAAGLEISMICPLHGPIWRKDISWFVDKYLKWATYTPEDSAVMIAYASIYGGTENAANILARDIADRGVHDIVVYDVSKTHSSEIVSQAFRCSHLVFASSTYNSGIFINMETVLLDLKAHNLQNRTVAFVENGSWAATSGALMKGIVESMKNMTVLEETASLKSSVKEGNVAELGNIADAIVQDMAKKTSGVACGAGIPNSKVAEVSPVTGATDSIGATDSTGAIGGTGSIGGADAIDRKALYGISYGLFVLTSGGVGEGLKDNGCIVNTLCQVSDEPLMVSVSVNKRNYTNELIQKTGLFNASFLTRNASMDVFKRFGFASGRDTDKFHGFDGAKRAGNGVLYIKENTNAYICAKVKQTIDLGSHWLYIAQVTEAVRLGDEPSCTYDHYLSDIKPRPVETEGKAGWVCKVCGYVYEGDELPEDFVCPICKHGVDAFERMK